MFPKRGIAALAITTISLAMLLSFRTPDQTLPVRSGSVAIVEPETAADAAPQASSAPSGTAAPDQTATPTPTSVTGDTVTIDGPAVSTRWGPVQVRIVVVDGQLEDVVALEMPTGHHSGDISARSEPILREAALASQSADIDIVSGATYTSLAYAGSLQAALDEAGIG